MLSDDLLELQRLDTALMQGRRRLEQLPELTAHRDARAAVAEAAAQRTRAGDQRAALEARIAAAEAQAHEIDVQRSRLEAQLKTVISPREAEALMHELEVLKDRRDSLDDDELAALEEEAGIDDALAELDASEPGRAAALAEAETALAGAQAGIQAELDAMTGEREAVAARLDAGELARYDERRVRFGGVAVAQLDGRRCTGCSLDLSVAEADAVRTAGPITECPECGRTLVIS